MADLHRQILEAPLGPIFLIVMQFSGKFSQIIGLRSPLSLAPPVGNHGSDPAPDDLNFYVDFIPLSYSAIPFQVSFCGRYVCQTFFHQEDFGSKIVVFCVLIPFYFSGVDVKDLEGKNI